MAISTLDIVLSIQWKSLLNIGQVNMLASQNDSWRLGYLVIFLLCTSCAGQKTASPVAEHYPNDGALTCIEIRTQQAVIDQEVRRLLPQTDKTNKNVALGAAGLFFIAPWFWMDFSKTEQIEVDAYRRRYTVLQGLEKEKRCSVSPAESSAPLPENQ